MSPPECVYFLVEAASHKARLILRLLNVLIWRMTNKAPLNTPSSFTLGSALSWILVTGVCVSVLVFVYPSCLNQTLPLKASSLASVAVSSSALHVRLSVCNLGVTFRSTSLQSVAFTQGRAGRASGGWDTECLRNVREHLGKFITSPTHKHTH